MVKAESGFLFGFVSKYWIDRIKSVPLQPIFKTFNLTLITL